MASSVARRVSSSVALRAAGSFAPPRGRGGFPPPARSAVGRVLTDLRRGREAVVEIDGHLDGVLDWLSDPKHKRLPVELPDRMRQSAERAHRALAAIGGPAGSELF